jgi:GT2 family glycosyltransferase
MEAQTKIAVVILNYNGIHWLKKFLKDVILKSQEAEVYVADNASTDKSLDFLKANFSDVKIIENKNNDGYSGGYNFALEKICADYYVLLNSDVEVSDNWIMPIINQMENDKNIAACQPKIRQYDNKEYFEYAGASGGFLDKYGFPFCRGRIFGTLEKDNGQYDKPIEVFWATGACLFVRASSFHSIGGIDFDFFAHMEEIDLCWRLKNKGFKIMCIPQSTVYHVGGGTLNQGSTFKTYLNYRNNLLMLYKNLEKNRFNIIFTRLVLDGVSSVKLIMDGKLLHIFSILKAHIHFYKYLSKFKKQRAKEFKAKLFPESIVYSYFVKNKKKFDQLKKFFN